MVRKVGSQNAAPDQSSLRPDPHFPSLNRDQTVLQCANDETTPHRSNRASTRTVSGRTLNLKIFDTAPKSTITLLFV